MGLLYRHNCYFIEKYCPSNFIFESHLAILSSFTWRRQWHLTPVLLLGKSHGRRSLVGCSPWGREESYTTARLHFHFSLSCIGEGNGNPLQCSCLENPRDGGAWRAAQSRTRLKRLSSSSSSCSFTLQRNSYSSLLKSVKLLVIFWRSFF